MSANDWHQRIVDLVRIKQELADVDAEGLWEWHLPAVGASDEQLAAVEEQLGEPLDPSPPARGTVTSCFPSAFPRSTVTFGIGRPGSSIPGTVVWLSGEEVDRWSDFNEFFLAMMDYNRADAEDLRRDAQRS